MLDFHMIGNFPLHFRIASVSTPHLYILGLYKTLRSPVVDCVAAVIDIAKFEMCSHMNPPLLLPKAVQRGDLERGAYDHLVVLIEDVELPCAHRSEIVSFLRAPPRELRRYVFGRSQRCVEIIHMDLGIGLGDTYFHLDSAVDTRRHLHHRHDITRVGIKFEAG